MKTSVGKSNESEPLEKGKRPYVKPAISEEESYETCVIMGCTKATPGPDPGCGFSGYKTTA